MPTKNLKVHVNGRRYRLKADPDEPLLWVLRDRLDLTGTKYGCGAGTCGACSVLIGGRAVRSCLISVGSVAGDGGRIITVEGLARPGELSALQRAFIDHAAFQCGFCTPGMLINATALLLSNPHPTRDEIIEALNNNLCRCGSYMNVLEAIEAVASGLYGPVV